MGLLRDLDGFEQRMRRIRENVEALRDFRLDLTVEERPGVPLGGASVTDPGRGRRFALDRGPLPPGTASGLGQPGDEAVDLGFRRLTAPASIAPADPVEPAADIATPPRQSRAPAGAVSSGRGGGSGGGRGGFTGADVLVARNGRVAPREFLGQFCEPIRVEIPNPANRLALQQGDLITVEGWDCTQALGKGAIFLDVPEVQGLRLGSSASGASVRRGSGSRQPIRQRTTTTAATDADAQIGNSAARSSSSAERRDELRTLREIRDGIQNLGRRTEDSSVLARVAGLDR